MTAIAGSIIVLAGAVLLGLKEVAASRAGRPSRESRFWVPTEVALFVIGFVVMLVGAR